MDAATLETLKNKFMTALLSGDMVTVREVQQQLEAVLPAAPARAKRVTDLKAGEMLTWVRDNGEKHTERGAFKFYRELTTNPGQFEVHTTAGMFYATSNLQPASFNLYRYMVEEV